MTEREREAAPSDEPLGPDADADDASAPDGDAGPLEDEDTEADGEATEAGADGNEAGGPHEPAAPGTLAPGAPAGRPDRGARRATAPARTAAPTPSELAVRIDDRVSVAFVGIVVGVFVLIFVYGIFLGENGVFSPRPTPSPVATPVATASPSPASSPSAAPSATAAPSVSAAPSGSAAPGGSAAPASPAPSASPASS